jgi:Bacterial PH domain
VRPTDAGCDHGVVSPVKFRYNAATAIAGGVAVLGAVPVATLHWYLAPILLVPLAVAGWGWRAGTDADPDGLSVRALLGSRRLPWSRVTGLVPDGRRVVAVLDGGTALRLPAVTPADLPRLVAASGQELTRAQPTA